MTEDCRSGLFADLPSKRRVHRKEPGVHFRSLAYCAARAKRWALTMIIIRPNAPALLATLALTSTHRSQKQLINK